MTDHADPDKTTPQDLAGLNKLSRVKFGFGVARGGQHTFLYGSGSVYEVRWRGLGTAGTLYRKISLQSYEWLSGAVLAPPGNGVY